MPTDRIRKKSSTNKNFINLHHNHQSMTTYTAQVNAIHKEFKSAIKKAKTRQSLNQAFSTHRKEHQKLLKEHLSEESDLINEAKKKLG